LGQGLRVAAARLRLEEMTTSSLPHFQLIATETTALVLQYMSHAERRTAICSKFRRALTAR
jgi:hypothetical protein